MTLGSKPCGRQRGPSAVTATTAAAVAAGIAVAGLHTLITRVLPGVRDRLARGRRPCFDVYADTSDLPFPHLPPQPADPDGIDEGEAVHRDGSQALRLWSSSGWGSARTTRRPADGTGHHNLDPMEAEAAVLPLQRAEGEDAACELAAAAVAAKGVAQQTVVSQTRAAVAAAGLVHPYLARIQGLMAATECPVLRNLSPPPGPAATALPAIAAAGKPAPAAAASAVGGPAWEGAAAAAVVAPAPVSGETLPAGCRVHWVSRPAELYDLGRRLRRERQIGLDTEASSLPRYHGLVCLLQLSAAGQGGGGGSDGGGGGGEVWLVDTLVLHDHVGPALGGLMADPRVIKVVHGGSNDVVWLQRDFRIYLVNVFDTEKACQVLAYGSRALSSLLLRHVGIDVAAEKAAGQRADWRRRPLPPALLRYAATDVSYLPYIADVLRRELAARGPGWPSCPPTPKEAAATAAPADQARAGVTADGGLGRSSVDSHSTADTGTTGYGSQFVLAPLFSLHPGPLPGGIPAPVSSGVAVQHNHDQQRCGQELGGGDNNGVARYPGGGGPVGRPVTTPLGHALLRSHQVSLTLYRKPPSDAGMMAAAAAAAAAAGGGGAAAGTATAAAATIMRRFFSTAPEPSTAAARSAACAEAKAPAMATRTAPSAAAAMAATDSVFALCRWRDATARRLDIGPQLLMPDAVLATLAAARPPPGDGRELLRMMETQLLAANEAIRAEPYTTRYELHPALRQHAEPLVRLLGAAAAGRLPMGPTGSDGQGLVLPAVCGTSSGCAGMGRRTRSDVDAAQERRSWLIEKFCAKSQVYQNCRMLSREGQLLCFCDTRKIDWYLAKGLAVQVCEDPPTIQLLFEHQNTDQQMGADDFYTQSKANRCVACGCTSHYLRYRVLPACYRRHMPPALKSHRSHDVVLLCIDCHERAQKASEVLKRQVAVEYGVPLLPPRTPAVLLSAAAAVPGSTSAPSPAATTHDGGARSRYTSSSRPTGQSGSGGGLSHSRPSDSGLECRGGHEAGAGDGACGGIGRGAAGGDAAGLGDGFAGRNEGSDEGADGDGSGAEDMEGLPGGIHPSAARRAALALQKNGAKMPVARIRQLEAVIKAALGRDPQAEPPGLRPGDLEAALVAGLGRRGRKRYLRLLQQQEGAQQPQHTPGSPNPDREAPTDAPQNPWPEPGASTGWNQLQQDPTPAMASANSKEGSATGNATAAAAAPAVAGVLSSASGGSGAPGGDLAVQAPSSPAVGGFSSWFGDRWLDSGHLWHGERVVRLAMQRGGEAELLQLVKRFRACFVAAVRPQFLPPAWEVDHAARRDFGPYSVHAAERRRAHLHAQQREQEQQHGDQRGDEEQQQRAS